MYGAGDVRIDTVPDARIIEPTDAVIRLSATCVCGSDLWPYRGIDTVDGPSPMGHEYAGIVEEVGQPDMFGPTTHHACCEGRVTNIHQIAAIAPTCPLPTPTAPRTVVFRFCTSEARMSICFEGSEKR